MSTKRTTEQRLHNEDTFDRDIIHSQDVLQVADLKKSLLDHRKQNEDHDRLTDEKFERLMPLADLIPALQEIVENQRAMSYVGKKILRILGYISATVTLLYLFFKFWQDIKK